jgi:hypothetical protein
MLRLPMWGAKSIEGFKPHTAKRYNAAAIRELPLAGKTSSKAWFLVLPSPLHRDAFLESHRLVR